MHSNPERDGDGRRVNDSGVIDSVSKERRASSGFWSLTLRLPPLPKRWQLLEDSPPSSPLSPPSETAQDTKMSHPLGGGWGELFRKTVQRGSGLLSAFSAATTARAALLSGPENEFPKGKNLSHFGMLCKAEFGGIQADLAATSEAREQAQHLCAHALGVVSVVDYFLDETDISVEAKLQILETMKRTLEKGATSPQIHSQLVSAQAVCRKLHAEANRLPAGELFIEQFCALADGAIAQIQFPGSFATAAGVGGETGGLAASIPQAISGQEQPKLMLAARLFGTGVQLLDDIEDFSHDLQRGLRTPITCAKKPLKAIIEARAFSKECFRACLGLLSPNQQQIYIGLLRLGSYRWREIRSLLNELPRQETL